MTEVEWLTCDCPLPMLIFLRGDVPVEQKGYLEPRLISGYGDLFDGLGNRISAEQCQLFILRCTEHLHQLPMDEASCNALAAYRRYVLERSPRDEFFQACRRVKGDTSKDGSVQITPFASGFWTDDPAGAARAASDIASIIANHKAKDSITVTCANATEDDWFAWGFFGGPPDPLWQATMRKEETLQAAILREIVGNPFSRDVSTR